MACLSLPQATLVPQGILRRPQTQLKCARTPLENGPQLRSGYKVSIKVLGVPIAFWSQLPCFEDGEDSGEWKVEALGLLGSGCPT